MNIHKYMEETAKEVDKFVLLSLKGIRKRDEDLYNIVSRLPKLRMKIGGSPKLRSAFGRIIYEILKSRGNWEEMVPILGAAELYAIHTYLIDDFMDNQFFRHGEEADWKKFGINKTLIGAIIQREFSEKLLWRLKTTESKKLKITELFTDMDYFTYMGQFLNEKMIKEISEEFYLKRTFIIAIDYYYIARMISAFCSPKENKIITEIGKNFSIMAMLRNDFMSLMPEEIKTKGKTMALKEKTYEDIKKGLWTFPVIHFINKSKALKQEKDFILSVLGKEDSSDEEIEKLIRLLIKYKSMKEFSNLIISYKNKIISLARKLDNKKGSEKLIDLCNLFDNVSIYYKDLKKTLF